LPITLSLHDALPISAPRNSARSSNSQSSYNRNSRSRDSLTFSSVSPSSKSGASVLTSAIFFFLPALHAQQIPLPAAIIIAAAERDRKSTRLNSSHVS